MIQKYKVSEQKSSSGKIYYRVRTGKNENSSPVYESFKQDLKAAEAFAKKLNARASAKRISKLQNLTQAEAEDINYASQKLASLGGATLREAVDWYEKTKFPEAGNFTATEVGEKYIAARRKEGIRETTLTNYESKIKIFSNYFNEKLINEITTEDLEKFFVVKGGGWGPNTMNPWMSFMKFFFDWCQRRKYIHQEGFTAAHYLNKPRRDITAPKLAPPHEAAEMLLWYCAEAEKREEKNGYDIAQNIRGSLLHLVLILFCGIRREEATKVTWSNIDLKGRILKVLPEGAKKKKRRVIKDAEENVWRWIFYCKKYGANLDGFSKKTNGKTSDPLRRLTYYQRKYRESFSKNGRRVPEIVATIETETIDGKIDAKAKNLGIMRHSFISYHMKKHGSAFKTSRVAGNSEKEVENTYMEVVEDSNDAEIWFLVEPPEILQPEDILEITLEEAFKAALNLRHLRPNVAKSKKIAQAAESREKLIWDYENQDGENIHLLAKKLEWFADKSVIWTDEIEADGKKTGEKIPLAKLTNLEKSS